MSHPRRRRRRRSERAGPRQRAAEGRLSGEATHNAVEMMLLMGVVGMPAPADDLSAGQERVSKSIREQSMEGGRRTAGWAPRESEARGKD